MSVFVDTDLHRNLKILALNRKTTLQALFAEIAKNALDEGKTTPSSAPPLTTEEINKSLKDARLILKSKTIFAHALRALLKGFTLLVQDHANKQ